MVRIAILGASGLIGSAIYRYLVSHTPHTVIGFTGVSDVNSDLKFLVKSQNDLMSYREILEGLNFDFIVNCAGITKFKTESINGELSFILNAYLPRHLAKMARDLGTRVIHISTDCVFDGARGYYTESDLPNATDIYGASKSAGEIANQDNFITLRTSVIGHERGAAKHGLLEWFLSQSGTCKGYKHAVFSGVSSLQLAQEVHKLISGYAQRGLYNLSNDPIDKYSLLDLIGKVYGKEILIVPCTELKIDRSLDATLYARTFGFVKRSWLEVIQEMRSQELIYEG